MHFGLGVENYGESTQKISKPKTKQKKSTQKKNYATYIFEQSYFKKRAPYYWLGRSINVGLLIENIITNSTLLCWARVLC